MDVLGRDDEVSSLQAFLDRPGDGGMAGIVLEGEAGIGKSTLWLAGVEAARLRGLSRPLVQTRRGRAGRRVRGAGRSARRRARGSGDELEAPRRRALETALLLREDAGAPVDFRTLAVAVRSALQVLAERRPILLAVDDVQWLDAPSTNRPGVRVEAIAGREHPAAPRPQARGRHRGVRARACAGRATLIERVHVGPLSPGALHAILQPRLGRAFARPTLLRLHEASGGNPFFALELARALGDDVDPTQPLPVPETLEALVRARLDGLPDETRRALLLACTHGRLSARTAGR